MVATVKDKYSTMTENDIKKLVIENGAYAVCEMLELLIKQMEKDRVSLR